MKTAIPKPKYLLLCLFACITLNGYSQTDTEFWLVVPEVTYAHNPAGGEPTYLHISNLDALAEVVISMPQNSSFTEVRFTMEPNSTQLIDLTWYIRDGYGSGPFDILTQVPSIGTPNEINILESGLPSTTGNVENKGIQITSSALITVYLERNNPINTDIWSLKGQNAKGTDFYVPTQNWMRNRLLTPKAFNSIDIVATEDTYVYFTPTGDVTNICAAGTTASRFLEKGQSLCLRATGLEINNHLGGTHIWSDGKIVVSWKDDSVYGDNQCYDVMGDQLVPTELAGNEYLVVRGEMSNAHEYVYIMSLAAGTPILFTDANGLAPAPIILGAPGTIERVLLNNNNGSISDPLPAPTGSIDALHIISGNGEPFIVFHVTGFGCESGASILPAINGCSGSTEVSFQRSTPESFFLNIFCKAAHVGDFMLTINGINYPLPPNLFTEIPGSSSNGVSNWYYLDKSFNEFTSEHLGIPAIPVGASVKVENTSGLFHLGIINGGAASGCRYAYLSNFSPNYGLGIVSPSASDYAKYCYHDTLQLQASGGIAYAWEYTQTPFIDTTFIDSKDICSPRINPPTGYHTYEVTITRSCYFSANPDTVIPVAVYGYPNIVAAFDTINTSTNHCSPFEMNFINNSIAANKYNWTFERGYDTIASTQQYPDLVSYSNYSYKSKSVKAKLKVSYSLNCPDTISKEIKINPQIKAAVNSGLVSDSPGELTQVYYMDTTAAGPISSIYFNWGDGQETELLVSELPDPIEISHTFINSTIYDTNYFVTLVFIDSVCNCRDTLTAPYMDTVMVSGKVKAEFSISDHGGCSPISLNITNVSTGNASYKWWITDIHDFSGTPTRTDNFSTTELILNNNTLTIPKEYYIYLELEKTNSDGTIFTDAYGPDTITVYPEFVSSIILSSETENCSEKTFDFNKITTPTLPNLSYLWNFGDGTTSSIGDPDPKVFLKKSAAINYTVALQTTSEYGCSISSPPLLIFTPESSSLTINDSITQINCKGDSTGTVFLTISNGVEPINYNWSTGDTSKNQINLKASSYEVTVTDSIGCSASKTIEINEPDSLLTLSGIASNINCMGDSTGAISLKVDGGVNPYEYTWSNESKTKDQLNLIFGNYSVTVNDKNGCEVKEEFTVNQPDSSILISENISHVKCKGDLTGALNLTVTGGIAPYSYDWSNNTHTKDQANLNYGNYQVSVSDSIGCIIEKAYEIKEPDGILNISAAINNVKCKGDSTGSVNLTISGGTTPYTYNWSTGETSKDIINKPSTKYGVTVTDSNSCHLQKEYYISQPSLTLSIAGTTTEALCTNDSSGTINIAVSGGVKPYTYIWNNGSINQNLTNLNTGNYDVTVSDFNGCQKDWATFINQLENAKIAGRAYYSSGAIEADDANVILYAESDRSRIVVEQHRIQANGTFEFNDIPTGNYLIYIKLDDRAKQKYKGVMSSYYSNVYNWHDATNLPLACTDSNFILLEMYENSASDGGNGHCTVKGNIIYDYGNRKSSTPPAIDVSVILFDEIAQLPYSETFTDENGAYEFLEVLVGEYSLLIDIPGVTQITTHLFEVSELDNGFENMDFEVDMVDFEIVSFNGNKTRIEEKTTIDFVKVFPNPTSTDLMIYCDYVINNPVKINIYTNEGKIVKTENFSKSDLKNKLFRLDLSGLRSGDYFIELIGDDFKKSEKIIIVK